MRQVVGFSRAIDRREDKTYYSNMCLQAAVHGKSVENTFEEVYPEHDEQEQIPLSPETAKLIDKLAQDQLAELEALKNGQRK